ncbi:MAG: sel1 repeat family protein, partial [Deltaproteobacteria bacterium]|nr:sel1 repeat family protein [Deltaproteobacteria bacterium]
AAKGVALAQMMLGQMYFKGEGVSQNYVQAYKWFYIAAETGDPLAQKALKITAKCMTQHQIVEAIRLAKEEKITKK